MNSVVVKDVIDKIISINKDLNEESLINLLIASGWDKNDIEIGRQFYNQKMMATTISYSTKQDTSFGIIKQEEKAITTIEEKDIHPTIVENLEKSIPVVYDVYANTLSEVKIGGVDKNNQRLYAWINVGGLIILLLILAVYIMRFSW